MTTYQVDKNKIDDYLKNLNKRRTYIFLIVASIVITNFVFIAYNLEHNFPFWFLIIVIPVFSVAFYFALKLANEKLKLLSNGQYFIDNYALKFHAENDLTKEFNLDEIAIIHKKYSGTMVVKGKGWTKFNYIRPKRSSYQVDASEVIFIPTITSNYADLVDKIKQSSKNAMKL